MVAPHERDGIVIERRRWIYRHSLVTRVAHWINALCFVLLLMSGLQIFNAHPALYFGSRSHFEAPSFEIKAVTAADVQSGAALKSGQSLAGSAQSLAPRSSNAAGDDAEAAGGEPDRGVVTAFGKIIFDTTGWLGFTDDPNGERADRAFPSWLTLPGQQDLATARRWHFTFAWLLVLNGLIYLACGAMSGHLRRDLWVRARELREVSHSIWKHMRLRFPRGDEARHYNVLQKLAYLTVIFLVLPAIILTGMTMSPGLDARFPFLVTLFGGRQSARTIHFILAFGLVAFALVHVGMVLLSGFANNMRSMITGRYVIDARRRDVHDHAPSA